MATETFSHRAVVRLPRAVVFRNMLDPAILKRCVEGCEELVLDTDYRYRVIAKYKVGPLTRTFKGTVMVTEGVDGSYMKFRRGSYKPVVGSGAFSGIVQLDDHPEGTAVFIEVNVEAPAAIIKLVRMLAPTDNARLLRDYTARFEETVRAYGVLDTGAA